MIPSKKHEQSGVGKNSLDQIKKQFRGIMIIIILTLIVITTNEIMR